MSLPDFEHRPDGLTSQFRERYARMSPVQLDQELRMMYSVLPKMEAVGDIDVGSHFESIGRITQFLIENPGLSATQSADEIPSDVVADFTSVLELEAQVDLRKGKESSGLLQQRMGILLEFAQITPSFRASIQEDYKSLCVYGFDGNPPDEYLSDKEMLESRYGWGQSETGSIFDSATAPDLDKKAYFDAVEADQDVDEEANRRIFEAFGIDAEPDSDQADDLLDEFIDLIPKELEEFRAILMRHRSRKEILQTWSQELSSIHGFSPDSLIGADERS